MAAAAPRLAWRGLDGSQQLIRLVLVHKNEVQCLRRKPAQFIGRELAFQARWSEATARWEREAAPLRDLPLVVQHKDLSYLLAWLGLREIGTLEPKPGLPPSTAHLAALLAALQRTPAKAVVRSAYQDPRAADWLARQAGMPSVFLPYTVGGSARAIDLITLYDDTIARLLEVAK